MRVKAAVALVALVSATVAPLVGSVTPAGAGSSICSIETGAKVGAALGVKVTKSSPDVQGSTTVCWYQVGANSHAAFVRVQTHDSTSGYQGDLKLAKTYGEHPATDAHFAPDPAFSTVLGSATYGFTYSVTVLKKTTEVSIGSVGSTLAKVEGLAKKVLSLV